jgi:hypothetical protein
MAAVEPEREAERIADATALRTGTEIRTTVDQA